MNYLAHGIGSLRDPHVLAGTAIPDWLRIVGRRTRIGENTARSCIEHKDPRVSKLSQGIVRHHLDDAWFHNTDAFGQVTRALTQDLRQILPVDPPESKVRFRPSFLAHIVTEILIDAALIEKSPMTLNNYYGALESLTLRPIADAVKVMSGDPNLDIEPAIDLFLRSRFLYDYVDDERTLVRLNQVLKRVGLSPLPRAVKAFLQNARGTVRNHLTELIPEGGDSRDCAPTR